MYQYILFMQQYLTKKIIWKKKIMRLQKLTITERKIWTPDLSHISRWT